MNGNAQQDRDGSAEEAAGAGGAPAYGTGAAPAERADTGGPAVEGVAPAAAVPEPVVLPAVPWRAVVVFVVLAFGLAWAACSPMWISGQGLQDPRFGLWTILMMYTPTVAALVAVFLVHRPRSVPRLLGLWPLRPRGRTIGFCLLALFGLCALPLLAILLGGALGLVQLDLQNLSGMAQSPILQSAQDVPLQLVLIISIAALPVNSLVSALATLGEEIGWRGWLLPNLRSLGTWPALLLSGVIWGVWHAPLILLGYNFGYTDLRGVGLMIVFCVFVGILLGWLRLRTATVWPCVLGHAAINSASSVSLMLLSASELKDVQALGMGSFLGIPGWILMAVVIVVLVLTGQLRKQVRAGVPTGAGVSGQ